MKRTFAAALLACTIVSGAAQAHFIDGYLAECSAVTSTTCTEFATTGYARQPIYFNAPTKGVTKLGNPFTFGAFAGAVAGRAIYDAPTGGNLLIVLPLATPKVVVSPDAADVAGLVLTFTAMAPYQYGETYIATIASGATLGTDTDGSTMTSGRTLSILRGELMPGTLTPS